MTPRVYRWQWHLRSPPEALWPLIADTNRVNRDVGLSGVEAAARLTELSHGDLVVSNAVREDPEVHDLLGGLALEPLEVELKGFEGERFALWRVLS